MRWQWDGVRFALLHPLPSNYDEPQRKGNDLSCVLRIESLGGNVLLTGDIEALTETELLQRDARGLAADVLVVPHHGSKTSATPAFIAAVAPRVAIVAAGYRNRFGHPRGEILARYLRAGAARPRTDLQGAITVTLEPGRALAVEAERDRHRRYWYDIAP
jgi:competence protein ComEC